MDRFVNVCVAGWNSVARGFCEHASAMFLQVGVLIAVLLAADLLLRQRIRATVRYWIWMLVLVKLLLPPSFSFPTGIGYWCGAAISLSPATGGDVSAAGDDRIVERGTVTRLVTSDTRRPTKRVSQPQPSDGQASPPTDDVVVRTGAMVGPAESLPVREEYLTWEAIVFLLWGAGVLVLGGCVVQRLLVVRRLLARGQPVENELQDSLDQCRRRMGVRWQVRLKQSSDTFSPAVCGLWRPTILVPTVLLERLSPDHLRSVLVHELAHVRRADLWVNCLQTALQVLYFYNPLVWLANAIVRRVREQAVDEMSLVALGAEAGSYGHTLIDIAEMAFWHASPALGLVGVAESKKSLDGRIRHMITRPIPKSARVGVIGTSIIMAVGVVLLPMAAAQTSTKEVSFTATLPDGATVELVGVCNWPASGPISWRADGSALDKALYASKPTRLNPGPNHYGFLFRVSGTDDIDLSWDRIEGSEGWEGSCGVVDSHGNRLEGHTAAAALMKKPLAQTSLRVGLATGPWRTISSHDGKGMSHGTGGGVLWSQAFDGSRGTYIVASVGDSRGRKIRMAAIDTGGAVHIARGSGSVSTQNVNQFTASFPDLKPAQIREFQYQVRQYEFLSFANVSLRPGQKTNVSVSVETPGMGAAHTGKGQGSREERTPQLGGALSDLDKDTDRKAYSRTRLENLGKAVLLYANNHADRIPDRIANVREYLNGVEVEWLLANAAYVGQGLSVASYPGRVVAYDKTLLAEGKGTNVLYLDSHVDFENLQELERIGISSARRDAALRTYEVNRSVVEFPRAEDFSTPEAAYATINRIDQGDPSAWQKVSVAALAEQFAREGGQRKTAANPEWAKVLSDARILGVMVWDNSRAAVMARLPQELSSKKIVAPIDVRYLELENGRWLNTGNNRFWTIEEAKAEFRVRSNGTEPKADPATVMNGMRSALPPPSRWLIGRPRQPVTVSPSPSLTVTQRL